MFGFFLCGPRACTDAGGSGLPGRSAARGGRFPGLCGCAGRGGLPWPSWAICAGRGYAGLCDVLGATFGPSVAWVIASGRGDLWALGVAASVAVSICAASVRGGPSVRGRGGSWAAAGGLGRASWGSPVGKWGHIGSGGGSPPSTRKNKKDPTRRAALQQKNYRKK